MNFVKAILFSFKDVLAVLGLVDVIWEIDRFKVIPNWDSANPLLSLMVRPAGFEPAAYGFVRRTPEFPNLLKTPNLLKL